MHAILFYIFGALAVISAVAVILLPKPTRALLSLIITMFSLSVIYVLLGATFFAMANLIVYAGAVLVLFLFVIMLQGVGAREIPLGERFHKGYVTLSWFVTIAFFSVIAILLMRYAFPYASGVIGDVQAVGKTLFTDYLLPFELTSLLLLIGVFAAVSLAKKDETV